MVSLPSYGGGPNPTFEHLFSAPVVTQSWRSSAEVKREFLRFGLQWKVYDLAGQKPWNWSPGILESTVTEMCGWVLGGIAGQEYLVRLEGLTQPFTGKGIFEIRL